MFWHRIQSFLWRLFLVAAAVGVYFLVRYLSGADLSRYYNRPDVSYSFEGMVILLKSGPDARWEAHADGVEVDRDERVYRIKDVNALYLNRAGKPPMVFSRKPGQPAPGGAYDSSTKKLELHSARPIEFLSENGDRLLVKCGAEADGCLFWEGRSELLRVPFPVETRFDGNEMSANSLEANQKSGLHFLKGDVSVFIPDLKNNKSARVRREFEESEIDENYGRDLRLKAGYARYDENFKTLNCYPDETGRRPVPEGAPFLGVGEPFPGEGGLPLPGESPLDLAGRGAPNPPWPGLPFPPLQGNSFNPQLVPSPEPARKDWRGKWLKGSHAKPVALSEKFVSIRGDRFQMRAALMDIYFENKYVRAVSDVEIVRFAARPDPEKSDVVRSLQKKQSSYYSDEAFHYWKEGRFMIPGRTLVMAENFTVTAGQTVINTKLQTSLMTGGVQLNQDAGDWILEEKLYEPESEKSGEVAREPTLIDAASLSIDFKNETLSAAGDATVRQEMRTLTGDRAFYSKAEESWTVAGSARGVEGEDVFDAATIVFFVKKNVTVAEEASSSFKADEEFSRDLKDYFNERDGLEPDEEEEGPDRIQLKADDYRYNEKTRLLELEGGPSLQVRDFKAASVRMEIDRKNKIAFLYGDARTEDAAHELSSSAAEVRWGDKRTKASGGVVLRYKGRKETEKRKKRDPFVMTCAELDYDWGLESGEASGEVKIKYPDREAEAPRAVFDNEKNRVEFFNGVKFHQEKGDWLRDMGRFGERGEDEDFWKIARRETWVEADHAFADDGTGYLRLDGSVFARQETKSLKSRILEVWDDERIVRAEGDVWFEQTDGNWLFEDEFIKEEEDEEVRERARKPVVIKADLLESDENKKQLRLLGDIRIDQENSFARGREILRDGNLEKTVFLGDVEIRDEKSRFMKGQKLVYYSKDRILQAFDAVQGKDFIKREKTAEAGR